MGRLEASARSRSTLDRDRVGEVKGVRHSSVTDVWLVVRPVDKTPGRGLRARVSVGDLPGSSKGKGSEPDDLITISNTLIAEAGALEESPRRAQGGGERLWEGLPP